MAAIATPSFAFSRSLNPPKLIPSFSHTNFPINPLKFTPKSSLKIKSTDSDEFVADEHIAAEATEALASIMQAFREEATDSEEEELAIVEVGDELPGDAIFSIVHPNADVELLKLSQITKNKKTVLFAVPGAWTPTCTTQHLPGFMKLAKEIKAKGVDHIACISMNDPFVMKHWKQDLKMDDEILMLSDGNGEFTYAIGCEIDLSDRPEGLGLRSRRYSMVVEDGIVTVLNLEEGGAFTNSGAEDILKVL